MRKRESHKLRKMVKPSNSDEQKDGQEDKQDNLSVLKSKFRASIIKNRGIYLCGVCTHRFSKLENIMKHIEHHVKVEKPFKCASCAYESLSIVELRKHLKVHHIDKTKPICNVCDHRALQWVYLMRHMVTHVDDGLYCKTCRRNFESVNLLKRHQACVHKRTGQRIYSCSKCSFTHSVKFIYKSHLLKCKQSKFDFTAKQDCVKTYKEKTRQVDRTLDKDETRNYSATPVNVKCKQTEKIVQECAPKKNNKTHNSHNISFPTVKSVGIDKVKWVFKCNKCSFTSDQLSVFIQHDKSCKAHHEKPFICNVCTEKTTLIEAYFDHTKSHSGIISYNCRFCQFSCGRKDLFEQHVKNHDLKCCPMCVFKSPHMSYLKRHVTEQHKSENKPFACRLCPYSSRSQSLLSAHSLKFHPKEFASLRLPVPSHLRYLVKHKKVVAHACRICSFRTTKSYDLKRHVIKHYIHGCFSSKRSRGTSSKMKTKRKSGLVKKNVAFKDKRPEGKSSTSMNENSNKNNHEILYHYRCTQCQLQSKYRKSISYHLLKVHNIYGGVRNNMILKIPTTSSQSSKSNKNKKTSKKHKTILKEHEKVNQSSPSILKVVKINNKSRNCITETCTKCNFHQLSIIAQRDHNKCGHDKYWSKPYACGVCGLRFINFYSCKRHKLIHGKKTLTCYQCNNFVSYRSDVLKKHAQRCLKSVKGAEKMDKEKQSKTITYKPNEDTLGSKEEEQISDDENFPCGECDYVTLNVTDLINHMFIHTGIEDE